MLTRSLAGLVVTLVVVLSASDRGDQNPQNTHERTTIFTCGEDQKLPEPIVLSWVTLVLAGDSRLFIPCPGLPNTGYRHGPDHREARESDLIQRAGMSRDPEIRWREAQVLARLGGGLGGLTPTTSNPTIQLACNAEVQLFDGTTSPRRWIPGRFFFMIRDGSPRVRAEAAYAIGVRLSEGGLDERVVTAATKEVRHCLLRPTDPVVTGLLLESLGVAKYPREDFFVEAEAYLVKESQGAGPKILGAVRGLEALIRLNAQRTINDATRVRLRQLALYGVRSTEAPMFDLDARVRRVALLALQAARDVDGPTLADAARDGDWQVRRLVAGRLNLSDPQQARVAGQLATDSAFQVRYELVASLSRLASQTHECAPIVTHLTDASPTVIMRAMDMLLATCTDLEDTITTLTEMSDKLAKVEEVQDWHLQSRALTTLARVKPDLAKPRLEGVVNHQVWQVRAAAAATSVGLADEEAAKTLAADPEPNVRTAALDALYRMKSEAVWPLAIEALKNGTDYQLLWKAAAVIKGLPVEDRPAASAALLGALAKLTEQETDTSRDPRVAIIERLGETLGKDRTNDLLPYTTDYDDDVVAAARTAFETLLGAPAASYPKRRRYPYQPGEPAVGLPPTEATIHLENGSVVMKLLPDVAPVTVARFVALVSQGFYKDRTFHRVVPNFVVQGGSPGANEYAGTSRYMRDEVGPQGIHLRGAVGISTRGTDTGDGQIFIDLVDLPRLDRDYTVFAYVTQGMEFVDRLLEGAKIVNISIK